MSYLDETGLTTYDNNIKSYIQSKLGSSVPVVTIEGTTITQQLDPNKFYSFGEVSTLTVSFGTPIADTINEYAFEFYSGATATVLTLPNNILWEEPVFIAANTHYIVGISYSNGAEIYYGNVDVIENVDTDDLLTVEMCPLIIQSQSIYINPFAYAYYRDANNTSNTDIIDNANIEYIIVDGKKLLPNSRMVYTKPGHNVIIKYKLANLEVIPNRFLYNGNSAGCSIKSVNIPNGVKYIGSSSFNSLTLESISGGNDVEFVELGAFASNSVWYNNLPNGTTYIGKCLYKIKSYDGDLVINPGTVSISNNASPNSQPNITSITIPDSVVYIGSSAFKYSMIQSINIPDSVTYIGNQAFVTSSSLTDVTIGSGILYIGLSNFSNATTVTIKATTPPYLSSASVFDSSKITNIYVPAASVDTYKAATNWSTFASKISAIQE